MTSINEDCGEVVSPVKSPKIAEGLVRAFPQLRDGRRAARMMQDP
eukprot:CAMPEP_0170505216 /NCGR_PEP_ID=MMETSP0208-20121228/50194_1 /TAXON_ID=197538 /ORGANISM="Strombidium inclinatum, Strain S3" /LENGTH=44 /DNA_ID= /DNA_START= /DNA_END= /DNA_ORIENTATION=